MRQLPDILVNVLVYFTFLHTSFGYCINYCKTWYFRSISFSPSCSSTQIGRAFDFTNSHYTMLDTFLANVKNNTSENFLFYSICIFVQVLMQSTWYRTLDGFQIEICVRCRLFNSLHVQMMVPLGWANSKVATSAACRLWTPFTRNWQEQCSHFLAYI